MELGDVGQSGHSLVAVISPQPAMLRIRARFLLSAGIRPRRAGTPGEHGLDLPVAMGGGCGCHGGRGTGRMAAKPMVQCSRSAAGAARSASAGTPSRGRPRTLGSAGLAIRSYRRRRHPQPAIADEANPCLSGMGTGQPGSLGRRFDRDGGAPRSGSTQPCSARAPSVGGLVDVSCGWRSGLEQATAARRFPHERPTRRNGSHGI